MSSGIKAITIESDRYLVAAAARDRKGEPECELLEFLEMCLGNRRYSGSAAGLYKLLEMFAHSGRDALTTDQTHYVDQKHKIYQLKKGDLRVLYFYANDKSIVICSHGFLKTTTKADKKEVKRAVSLQKEYLETGMIEFIDSDTE